MRKTCLLLSFVTILNALYSPEVIRFLGSCGTDSALSLLIQSVACAIFHPLPGVTYAFLPLRRCVLIGVHPVTAVGIWLCGVADYDVHSI